MLLSASITVIKALFSYDDIFVQGDDSYSFSEPDRSVRNLTN